MPEWRRGMAVGDWRAVPASALASAPMAVPTYPALGASGPAAKVFAWNGFAVDTRDSTIWSVANGGHNDYAGNEVNRLRLLDSVPAWTEPRASTPVSQIVPDVTHYADGRPTSRHTYYGSIMHEGRNRAMLFSGSRYGNGYILETVDGFNLSSNDWDPARTYANSPSAVSGVPGAAMTLNTATGDVYAFSWSSVLRWNNSTNTWTTRLSSALNGQYAASAYDPKRNRILLLGGDASIKAVYDVASNTMQSVALSGADAGSLTGSGNGMVYDPLQDAFLLRKSTAGAAVYRINAGTFAVDQMPVGSTGGSIPFAQNGVWTRFLYVPALKGVVYAPAYEANLWFLRTG